MSQSEHLQAILALHPAGFRSHYPDRLVNNIYFDDVNFSACNDNLFGISDRVKLRYRWYGGQEKFSQGILERKIKHNALGTKEYIKLDAVTYLNELQSKINGLDETSGLLIPSLQNSYLRSYYIDQSKEFRLTIDRKLRYNYPPDLSAVLDLSGWQDDRIIVEIKFDVESYSRFLEISKAFPFRLNKHSKYVTGLLALVY